MTDQPTDHKLDDHHHHPGENLPVESNGGRVMPHIVQEQINTWTRYGLKILRGLNSPTILAQRQKMLCVVTVDEEKMQAIIHELKLIDTTRQAQTNTVKVSMIKPDG